MAKAVALLSGGLDSTLAILVLLRQGIDVTALTFLTHFGCDISDSSSCSKNPYPAAEKFGFRVKLCHLSDQFLEIVKNPKYGHGKNMNPCVDCRILMLKEAKRFMAMSGADFLVTGEVLGQRPMSQRKDSFPLIDREAEVQGLVLRPLSAKLLKPTLPEIGGMVDRSQLYGFSGRSRRPQIALAAEFGLSDYPPPAGGCLLTDPLYSARLRDLLSHASSPDVRDITLLRTGRHFRAPDGAKIIVGRDEKENQFIESLSGLSDWVLIVEGFGSPLTVITGEPDEDALLLAAAITARYSDAKRLGQVEVTASRGMAGPKTRVVVAPATDGILETHRVGKSQIAQKRR